jgi:LysM repeat protein
MGHTGRLRLTRRGRAVVLGFLIVVTTSVGAVVASTGEAAAPRDEGPVAVVQPGDTLWRIAARELPGKDPWVAVNAIRHLNDIEDYTVQPGQELLLPVMR